MILRWLPLALFAIVFTPDFLHAQSQSDKRRRDYVVTAEHNYDKMYEDIEIFGRILNRKLTLLYPSETSARTSEGTKFETLAERFATMPGSSVEVLIPPEILRTTASPAELFDAFVNGVKIATPSVIPIRSLEGVYLKGQGVVYTATLASLQPSANAMADSTTKEILAVSMQQDSEWENVRRQVRNEKEKPRKPEASKPPSLSDVLLKVLAENGHNFSQLGENESMTIILTVHESNPPAAARKSSAGGKGGSAKSGTQLRKSTGVSYHRDDASDQELLGDLHQKQGHYEAALRAFTEAATREPGPSSKDAQRLYRKIAQCYLALGQDDKARKALDQILSFEKESTDAKDKPAAAKPAAALPVKLIISASKKLLDQVKEGKISFEEFRRQAHVETLRFGDRR